MKLSLLQRCMAKAALAGASLVAVAGSAQAAVYDFYYNTPGSSQLVATMTTSGSTTFTLDFVYAPAEPGTAFINDVLFLNTGGATLSNSTFTNLGPELGTASYSANGFEGQDWNWKVSFPTSNNANRFQEGESTSWSIVSTTVSDWDFGRLHINAFLNGQSIKLVACDRGDPDCDKEPPLEVSEPATLALLGLGLVGLGIARRRRA